MLKQQCYTSQILNALNIRHLFFLFYNFLLSFCHSDENIFRSNIIRENVLLLSPLYSLISHKTYFMLSTYFSIFAFMTPLIGLAIILTFKKSISFFRFFLCFTSNVSFFCLTKFSAASLIVRKNNGRGSSVTRC